MPKIESKISIEDRGLNFSDGIYEVIRFKKRGLRKIVYARLVGYL